MLFLWPPIPAYLLSWRQFLDWCHNAEVHMDTAASTLLISKRKAEYGRADRATYKNKNRKEITKKAAQNRWKSVDGQSESLSDVANTPLVATAPHVSTQLESRNIVRDNLGTGLEVKFKPQCGGMCVLEGETMHAGLETVLSVKCIKCESNFRIE